MTLFVFDMDGTVLDSMPTLTRRARDLIHLRYGIPLDAATKLYETTTGYPFATQLEMLFPGDEKNADVAFQYELVHELDAPYFLCPPGVADVIDSIKLRRHKSVLVSSTADVIVHRSAVKKLSFDFIYGFAPGNTKLVQVQRAIQMFARQNLERVILFGDSELDGICARQVQVEFVRVTCGTVVAEVRKRLETA
jgi:phosphoglycolate phosphatase-like HAD superfamily hydrolase